MILTRKKKSKMHKYRIGLNFDRCLSALVLLVIISLVLTEKSLASENLNNEYDENFDPNQLVEVHVLPNPNLEYHEKKTNWSWRFGIMYEKFTPSSFTSPLDGATYLNLYGAGSVTMGEASFGVQYNASLFAIYTDLMYGAGTVSGPSSQGAVLSIAKTAAEVGILFDRLFKDPWASPFIGVQAVYFGWNEVDNNTNPSGVARVTIGTRAGLAIHLNKIDSETAKDSYIGFGIKNTFLDLFFTQYAASPYAKDPNLQSAWNFGASFRFEF